MKVLLFDPKNMPQPDKWREAYNPLRWLVHSMIVGWLQEEQLGAVANITWLYRFVEERYPTLSALIDRRTGAIEKLGWDVKTLSEDQVKAAGYTMADAEAQQAELRDRYNNVDNLREAINFLALASFRRFSHLEKRYDGDGNECHLEPVPQWNWSRSGMAGPWWYNQGAYPIFGPAVDVQPSAQLKPIDLRNFIIREVDRPIDVVAIWCFMRAGMSQKDWDGFIETFGIAPIFIELPPDMPASPAKQAEYQATAEEIISNARGTLPNGAKVHTVEAQGGTDPFEKHIRYQDEQVVLKGTGGLLTMLTQAGSGTLAGGAHQDSFDLLAEAEADRISEIFQQQFDKPILDEEFAEQPRLAFFQLAAKESTDTAQVVTDVQGLAGAGLEVDPAQIEELTGYRVELRTPVDATDVTADKGNPSAKGKGAVANRARLDAVLNRVDERALQALIKTLGEHIDDATDGSWAPIANRVAQVLDSPDEQFVANMKQLATDCPELLKDTGLDAPAVKAWQDSVTACLFNGFENGSPKPARKAASAPKTHSTVKNRAKKPLQSIAKGACRAPHPLKS